MHIIPDPDLYRDFQANLAGLPPQQLTTEEREALEARLQLQKNAASRSRGFGGLVRRLIARLSGSTARGRDLVAQPKVPQGN